LKVKDDREEDGEAGVGGGGGKGCAPEGAVAGCAGKSEAWNCAAEGAMGKVRIERFAAARAVAAELLKVLFEPVKFVQVGHRVISRRNQTIIGRIIRRMKNAITAWNAIEMRAKRRRVSVSRMGAARQGMKKRTMVFQTRSCGKPQA